MIAGCDEAGRGPLIGPLIVSCVGTSRKGLEKMVELGVTDSKQLTPGKREELFPQILRLSEAYGFSVIPPPVLDRYNLNTLTYEAIENIIANLINVKPIEEVYIDKVGNSEPLKVYLTYWLGIKKVVIEEKADAKYVIVGAASIVAKVIRDSVIRELSKKWGDFGSGYPSDERTRAWIREFYSTHGHLPNIVRKTWKSLKDLAPDEYIKKED